MLQTHKAGDRIAGYFAGQHAVNSMRNSEKRTVNSSILEDQRVMA